VRREIVVNATTREKRVAILEDGKLVELMYERPDERRIAGDIYLGVVEAIVPGLQAAFVDIGVEKSAFLHASDLQSDEDSEEDGNGGREGNGGRRRARNENAPRIEETIRKDQRILVQVVKEPIGTKGARVTTQVSLPGRFLVYIPDSSRVGVSRKIGDRETRARLRGMVRDILGDDGGAIVRTVGEELTKEACERELKSLRKTWRKVRRRQKGMKAPALVYQDARLTSGIIRDLFSNRIDLLTVDSAELYHEIRSYLGQVDPDLLERVTRYESAAPIFDEFGIEEEIRRAFRRTVHLKSGGHVVIEQTEALVSIDVNTGRFTGRKKDPEHTILKTNLDAAREIAIQLRLRDIGGIIVIDFIDMESQENRNRVLHELRTHLGRDRARTRTWEVSELGLIEMTRQRVRPSILQSLTEPCAICEGSGRIWTAPTLVREIERSVSRAALDSGARQILICVHPQVALRIMEFEPRFVRKLAQRTRLRLDLRDDPLLRPDEYRLLSGRAGDDVTDRYRTM